MVEQKLESFLNFLMRPAVEYNLPQKKYWGIATKDDSILVGSGFFIIEIGNIKFVNKPEGEFFNKFNSTNSGKRSFSVQICG